MKTFVHKNGYKSIYDETFKPGDLITGYYSGIFSFVKYEDRSDQGSTPLVFISKKYNAEGKPVKGKKVFRCDAPFCRKAEEFISNRLTEIEVEKANLSAILLEIKNKNED